MLKSANIKCKHIYKNSQKKDIEYCIFCGNLSYKKIPSLSIKFKLDQNITIDPLLLKFKQSKKTIDYSNNLIMQYISYRRIGINQIKLLSNFFSFSKNVLYKAIYYLDQIYLNNPSIPFDLIEKISSVCLLLSVQFNECCSKDSKIEIVNFINLLSSKIENFHQIEILCLKNLDYNLGIYSSYDYINLFFSLGLIFPTQNLEIEKNEDTNIFEMYFRCINILDIIIDDYRSLEFTQYNIAITIISMVIIQSKFFSFEIFKYVYGIDLFKEKYKKCQFVLKSVYLNNYFINNDSTNKKSNYSINSDSTFDTSISE